MTVLLVDLGAALALFTLLWGASLARRDASIVDIFWGPGFVLLAWIAFVSTPEGYAPRKALLVGLVTLWGLRLAAHILWRARGRGEDARYRDMREKWGRRFWWVSLFTIFWLQAVILWVVALPLYVAQSSPVPERLTWWDVLGAGLFAAGFVFEALGDWQLARFKSDPRNRGRLMTAGLWRYTRHPNYFGDAVLWWGLTCFALATPGSAWVVVSPAIMTTLLMKVSGVSLLDRKLAESKPGFRDYARRTNAFFPWFPRRSAR